MLLNSLSAARCALLVVDIQERLMPVIEKSEQVEKNSKTLIKAARTLQMPVVASTQYALRIGEILPGIQAELGEVVSIDKMEFNCFANENFRDALHSLPKEIDTFVICGVETHICIYQTVLGGLMAGFNMWVASDAVSSRNSFNYRDGLARIEKIGGVVGSSELIIYELLTKAGTPEFKALLPSLK